MVAPSSDIRPASVRPVDTFIINLVSHRLYLDLTLDDRDALGPQPITLGTQRLIIRCEPTGPAGMMAFIAGERCGALRAGESRERT